MKQKFIRGLNHQAIIVRDFEVSKAFYIGLLGMELLYEDAKHVFLRVGEGESFGILALLIQPEGETGIWELDGKRQGNQYNHFGFRATTSDDVFEFAEYLNHNKVPVIKGPYSRKDGASVYFLDPNGYTLEYLYLIEDPKVYR